MLQVTKTQNVLKQHCTKQVHQQDTYPTNAGGGSYNYVQHPAPPPFSRTSLSKIVCLYLAYSKLLQELSYRKQIARKLCTQYVKGIYSNPVTLKSTVRVTQGHWKRNYWIDHTRLTISRVNTRHSLVRAKSEPAMY